MINPIRSFDFPIAADYVVEFLNSLLVIDKAAVQRLVDARTPCNQALADHPTVQCGKRGDGFEVGILGVLNGLLGVDGDGWGFLCAVYEDDGTVRCFSRTPPREVVS